MLEVKIAAKPFLKWVGGKGRLVPQLRQYYPVSFKNYFEPFFGGGAVFFDLTFSNKAYINDINDTLIEAYIHIREDVEALIRKLEILQDEYRSLTDDERQEFYYQQREKFNNLTPGITKTTLLIFLNKTCFNGLYRENKKGKFNVPFGRYANPSICNKENLRAISKKLQTTTITSKPYREAVKEAKAGDFVYLDPPYHPLNATSSFTAYHEGDFTAENQKELRDLFVELDKRGCYVMLSNSASDYIRELYKDYGQESVLAARSINSNATKRGKISELVVLNY